MIDSPEVAQAKNEELTAQMEAVTMRKVHCSKGSFCSQADGHPNECDMDELPF